MNRKFISLILVFIIIASCFCVNSVFASSGTGVNCDFSKDSGYLKYNMVDGIQDYTIEKGQYGKGYKDSSLRMYTTGGSYFTDAENTLRSDQYIRFNTNLAEATENEYIHVSFEYLRENLFCGLSVTANVNDSAGTLLYSKNILGHLSDNSTHIQARLLSGAKNSSGYNHSYVETVGTWNKIEIYFSPKSNSIVAFVNGSKVELTLNTSWGGSTFTQGVKNVPSLMFKHVVDAKSSHNPSAVQIDNVIVEKVSLIPDSSDFKKLGETLDFDDNMFIYGTGAYGSYGTLWYNGSADSQAQRFKDYSSARPSVRFLNRGAVSIKGGVYGRPNWDNSLLTSIPSDASSGANAMWYTPGINDISLGESAHLTFSVANKSRSGGTGAKLKNSVFTDGTVSEAEIFEMSAQTGRFKFFGVETDVRWQNEKWYKIDIVFNVSNSGTTVDCYIDGKKTISDYKWSSGKLTDTGTIYFADLPGLEYYLDDISFGRFNSSDIHNPSAGFSITDTSEIYIDNTKKIIAIKSDASISDYKNLIPEKENITIYNNQGSKVYEGTLNSAHTVKISNGFGAGLYYNVGYNSPRLDVGDVSYNESSKRLSAKGYIGFDIKEDYLASDANIPTSGTLVLAVYSDGTMEQLKTTPYTALSELSPAVAQLDVESLEGKTVKVFIVDSLDNLIPLVKNKEFTKSDFDSQIADNESDIPEYTVYESTRIHSYFDFEEDDDWFKEDGNFDTWYLETVASGNSIEVKTEENGNRYLSLDTLSASSSTPSASVGMSNGQKIVEFDICSPTKSSTLLLAVDKSGAKKVIFTINYDGKMYSSDNIYLGLAGTDSWNHISVIFDTGKNITNYYVDGVLKAVNVPLPAGLDNINSIKFECARSKAQNTLMLDNIIVYSGSKLHDFSALFAGNVDESVVAYEHNIKGVEEFLSYYSAIHTDTGKMYTDSLKETSEMPYYNNGVLMVSQNDAEELVFGKSNSGSTEFVSLDEYASDNGKTVTYTKTGTVFVGDRDPGLDTSSLKTINAYLTYDRPDASYLKNSFTSSHPRAMLSQSKLDEISADYGTNEYVTKWVDDIIERADYFARTGVRPFVPPENNGRLLPTARNTEEELQKLALAYYLTGKSQQKYVDAAWAEIENACNYPHWHQQINDLDSAIMASVIAYGYDWFYDEWTPQQRKIMEDAVWKNQLQYAYEAYHGYRYNAWATVTSNWNSIINGYTALAACVFYESDPQKCADIIENALRNSEYVLNEFYPNGAWGEGPSYWHNTVAPFGALIYTLENTFGSHFNLHHAPGLSETAKYMIGASGPYSVNNFNDAGIIKYSTTSNMFWLSDMCNIPEYTAARLKEMDSGATTGDVYDLCYYNSKMHTEGIDVPLDVYFEDIELVSLRSAHDNPDATYVSFHSGKNMAGQNHSHIDSGTFVIDMLGERFAHDIGSHNYYATGWGNVVYGQPTGSALTRWDYYHNIPQGHNTLVINPKEDDIGQNIVSDDKITAFVSENNGSYAITELSSAYLGYAKNVRRGIMLGDNRESVLIRDEIELNDGNNEIYWFMHTDINTEVEFEDENTLLLIQNGKEVRMRFITNADTSSMYVSPCTTVNFTLSPEQEQITSYKKIVIKMTAKDSMYLAVKLAPYFSDSAWEPIDNICLNDWTAELVK